MELSPHDGSKEHNLTLTEIQASVTEAANVIEHEIKGWNFRISMNQKLMIFFVEY